MRKVSVSLKVLAMSFFAFVLLWAHVALAQVGSLTTNTFQGAVNDSGIIGSTHVNAFYANLPAIVTIGLILWVIKMMRGRR